MKNNEAINRRNDQLSLIHNFSNNCDKYDNLVVEVFSFDANELILKVVVGK